MIPLPARSRTLGLTALLLVGCQATEAPAGQAVSAPQSARSTTAGVPSSEFGATIARLSEEGGYFDTDNLISNESSFLHVAQALRSSGLSGGAYLGVGPDQNFSYMALLRPEVAYLVDVRRDNLLQHLLYKALFHEGANRVEFLSLLYGRPPPEDLDAWASRSVHEVVAWVDGREATAASRNLARERVWAQVSSFGFPLDDDDISTIERFHNAFIEPGLDLRFTTLGRAPRFFYPTHRDLLLAEDLNSEPSSYLAREEDYQFLRALQLTDAVIPVVGNLAGSHALLAIGADARERGLQVRALYTSNVEFYLWGDGTFERFAENVDQLPTDPEGMIIRSYFRGAYRQDGPTMRPGFYSAQLLHRFEDMAEAKAAGGFRGYGDLVTRDPVPLEPVGSGTPR